MDCLFFAIMMKSEMNGPGFLSCDPILYQHRKPQQKEGTVPFISHTVYPLVGQAKID